MQFPTTVLTVSGSMGFISAFSSVGNGESTPTHVPEKPGIDLKEL